MTAPRTPIDVTSIDVTEYYKHTGSGSVVVNMDFGGGWEWWPEVGDKIAIEFDDGTRFESTVSSVDGDHIDFRGLRCLRR